MAIKGILNNGVHKYRSFDTLILPFKHHKAWTEILQLNLMMDLGALDL